MNKNNETDQLDEIYPGKFQFSEWQDAKTKKWFYLNLPITNPSVSIETIKTDMESCCRTNRDRTSIKTGNDGHEWLTNERSILFIRNRIIRSTIEWRVENENEIFLGFKKGKIAGDVKKADLAKNKSKIRMIRAGVKFQKTLNEWSGDKPSVLINQAARNFLLTWESYVNLKTAAWETKRIHNGINQLPPVRSKENQKRLRVICGELAATPAPSPIVKTEIDQLKSKSWKPPTTAQFHKSTNLGKENHPYMDRDGAFHWEKNGKSTKRNLWNDYHVIEYVDANGRWIKKTTAPARSTTQKTGAAKIAVQAAAKNQPFLDLN